MVKLRSNKSKIEQYVSSYNVSNLESEEFEDDSYTDFDE